MPRAKLNARNVRSLPAPSSGQTDYFDELIPGLALRVFSSGNRSWLIFYRFSGRFRRLTLGQFPKLGLAAARDLAKKKFKKLSDDIDPAAERRKARTGPDFKSLATEFLKQKKGHKGKVLRPKTLDEWHRIVQSELIPRFGAMKPAEITREDVKAYLAHKAETAPYMSNRCLEVMRRIYFWALKEDKVQTSPCVGIDKYGEEVAREYVLSDDELQKVLKALDEERPIIAGFFRMLFLTGARKSEVLGARWNLIDLNRALWTFEGKGGGQRLLPLSTQAIRMLRELYPFAGHSKWVFVGPTGDNIQNPQKAVQRLRKRSGVEFRIHDIRRTTATGLAQIGIHRDVISTVLGHVLSGSETTRIYDRYHRIPEMRDALEKWARHIEQIVSGSSAAGLPMVPR